MVLYVEVMQVKFRLKWAVSMKRGGTYNSGAKIYLLRDAVKEGLIEKEGE